MANVPNRRRDREEDNNNNNNNNNNTPVQLKFNNSDELANALCHYLRRIVVVSFRRPGPKSKPETKTIFIYKIILRPHKSNTLAFTFRNKKQIFLHQSLSTFFRDATDIAVESISEKQEVNLLEWLSDSQLAKDRAEANKEKKKNLSRPIKLENIPKLSKRRQEMASRFWRWIKKWCCCCNKEGKCKFNGECCQMKDNRKKCFFLRDGGIRRNIDTSNTRVCTYLYVAKRKGKVTNSGRNKKKGKKALT
jgi:hypothetical protein